MFLRYNSVASLQPTIRLRVSFFSSSIIYLVAKTSATTAVNKMETHTVPDRQLFILYQTPYVWSWSPAEKSGPECIQLQTFENRFGQFLNSVVIIYYTFVFRIIDNIVIHFIVFTVIVTMPYAKGEFFFNLSRQTIIKRTLIIINQVFLSKLTNDSIDCPVLLNELNFKIPRFQSRTTYPFFIPLCTTNYFRNRSIF